MLEPVEGLRWERSEEARLHRVEEGHVYRDGKTGTGHGLGPEGRDRGGSRKSWGGRDRLGPHSFSVDQSFFYRRH